MARPACRSTLSSPSTGGPYPPVKQEAGHGGELYVFLLVLNVLLIFLFYFGIWRFVCKKKQRVDDDTNSATTSSSTPNSPNNICSRNGRLDSRVLSSLPIFVYSIGSEAKRECAVCLMEFKEGETGRLLPRCNHGFHTECVDMWFQSHSTCPLCRVSIEAGDSDSTAAV